MHDKTNPAVSATDHALLARLHSLRKCRAHRDRTGLFAIEGIRPFIRACDAGFEFETIFVSPILLRQGIAQRLVRRLKAAGVRNVVLTPERFRAISTTERASGIAAIVRQRWSSLQGAAPRLVVQASACDLKAQAEACTTRIEPIGGVAGVGWLVIDSLRAAGNLGTILRTAEAVGMSGVIFAGNAADPWEPAVIRASMGGISHIPLIRTTPRELGYWLAAQDINLVGLSPCAPRLWTDLPAGRTHAIALGDERTGLSPPLRRLCDTEVRLPMTGRADSLNVAIAAGVMMYELLRNKCSPGYGWMCTNVPGVR